MAENPYEPPVTWGSFDPPDENRLLRARFAVERRENRRVILFFCERQTWRRQIALVVSTALIILLLLVWTIAVVGMEWLALGLLFVIHHVSFALAPYVAARRQLKQCERSGNWPAPWGDYEVTISTDTLQLDAAGHHQQWALPDVEEAYYLGDVLLICPRREVVIPIPRDADFDGDTFATFCRSFAMRFYPAGGDASVPR